MAETRPLNAELRKVAKEEINEVEERIIEDIQALREYLEKQLHIRARVNDQFLVGFLRGSKYSLEKAKAKIAYHYVTKALMQECLSLRSVEDRDLQFGRTGAITWITNGVQPGGPAILLCNAKLVDTKQFHINDVIRYRSLAMDYLFTNSDNCTVAGMLDVIDYAKLPISLIGQIDFNMLGKLTKSLQRSVPVRFRAHLINCTREANVLINFIRKFLSDEWKERLFVHKNLEEFYKVVPKEFLPAEWGGSNGTTAMLAAENVKQLMEFKNYFEDDQQFGLIGRSQENNGTSDPLFGLDGSFRKLNFD